MERSRILWTRVSICFLSLFTLLSSPGHADAKSSRGLQSSELDEISPFGNKSSKKKKRRSSRSRRERRKKRRERREERRIARKQERVGDDKRNASRDGEKRTETKSQKTDRIEKKQSQLAMRSAPVKSAATDKTPATLQAVDTPVLASIDEIPDFPSSIEEDVILNSETKFGSSGRDFSAKIELLSWVNAGTESAETTARLDAGATFKFNSHFSATANGRLRFIRDFRSSNPDGDQQFEFLPREIHITAQTSNASVTVGNQIVRWGVSDFFTVNDPVNPNDFRDRTGADLQSPHIPIPAVRGLVSLGPVSLEGVVVPVFFSHRFRPVGNQWGFYQGRTNLLSAIDFLSQDNPAARDQLSDVFSINSGPALTPDNASAGGRLNIQIAGIDAGFNAYYGWDRYPQLIFDEAVRLATRAYQDAGDGEPVGANLQGFSNSLGSTIAGGGSAVQANFRRIAQFGGDLTFTASKFLFKLEGNYSSAETVYVDDDTALVRLPVVSAVAGVDYSPSNQLTVSAEGFARQIIGRVPTGVETDFFTGNDTVIAGGIRYAPTFINLRLQVAGSYSTLRRDYRLSPRLDYQISPRFSLGMGATILGGPSENTFGGVYGDNDHVFAVLNVLAL